MNEILIPEYTKSDYLYGTEPFEWLYQFRENPLKSKQIMMLMSEKAKEVGVRNFISLFKLYVDELAKKNGGTIENVTDFEGQEIQLECGEWYCDDFGITGRDRYGMEIIACNHPIMPVQRLVNIDSGAEKLKLSYRKGKVWRSIIADKKSLASNNSILQLAEFGVAVNSENSKYLVKYLADIEFMNYERIEEVNSVGRLGWIDGYGFSPYVDSLIFDGNVTFKHFFESVREQGSYEKWLELVKVIRRSDSIQARVALAASFSSVLVHPLGALPFFTHFWGTTESGKTVALMLAASVWANPKLGEYIHTFNSTNVAQELAATFVNSMPLILDELQIVKDKKDFDNMIYQLTEGVGRSRGAKTGGLQKNGTWANCIMTNGEGPISTGSSGGGSVNRIIEIECNNGSLFEDCRYAADTLKMNYGHAGKVFVTKLQEDGAVERAKEIQKQYIRELSQSETTEKQAISASIILTADRLISEWIFGDDINLTVEDIKPFLSTKNEVSNNLRAYEYLFDRIAMAENNFSPKNDGTRELWGYTDDDFVYIIKTKFDELLYDGGYNPASVLSWLIKNNYVETSGDRKTKVKKIGGVSRRCIWLKWVEEWEDVKNKESGEIPF